MTKKEKKALWRILAGLVLFAAALLLPLTGVARLIAFLVPYFVVGGGVLKEAAGNLLRGQMLDENFLMSLATVGAFAVGEYPEGVAVMVFYQVGELFEHYAVGKSRASIASLMDIRPDYANIRRGEELVQVDPETIKVGDIIVVKPGEKIPLDGTIISGSSMADTAALTGESVPRELAEGDNAVSGCINLTGLLEIQVAKEFGESTVAKILDLVENASSKKAASENFITKFARYYTPVVVACAALLAFVPPIFVGNWSEWIHRALIFLVISCPCALVISVPLSFFGGIGGASRRGILVKGSNYLEALSKAEFVVFDKTGTLTKGSFDVVGVYPKEGTQTQLLTLAALCESYSDHPISKSLKKAAGELPKTADIGKIEEIAGHGVQAEINGKVYFCGNEKLMRREQIEFETPSQPGTVVYLAEAGRFLGAVLIADEPKADASVAIEGLRKAGIRKTVMLTGDAKAVGETVGKTLGLDEVHAELLPGDKVDWVEKLLAQTSEQGKLVFVGDGINDAPVLSRADIGIAMGGLGSDAAIEAADIVLMDDKPSGIVTAIAIAQKTLKIVKQNIIFALGVKFLVLILGALGMANMWEAVFADVGVSVIAIINATRALNTKNL
ncbi:heavy metal translocating P-type ATPase [Pygmaiobacter massiliensis]|uniref:heavy metal translocating P-type ATPase n=1 Tax=Pygmaiobacter massiliensis TaxID=1917873 RepID=UPI000C7AD6FE|nr:heavy metal translocating P-type ATPase [Pygmaiobacter massiliensis]